MEKLYCVFDNYYGDYVESFDTERQAIDFCNNIINRNLDKNHDFNIGKWIGNTDKYEKIKHIYYKAE